MKWLIIIVVLTTAYTHTISSFNADVPVSLIEKYVIPWGEKIRQAEEHAQMRISGGSHSNLGEYPYQVGILSKFTSKTGTGVCGGSLVSTNRVITAAHCWFDGIHQAWKFTVVLGSTTLFSGGVRQNTSAVALHPNWLPVLKRNDVAVVYLPMAVNFSDIIAPIALPTANELNKDFVGARVIASGFGITANSVFNAKGGRLAHYYDGAVTVSPLLTHVGLNVISNKVCKYTFSLLIQPSNICTSGLQSVSTCQGDSGGPLAVIHNGRRVLIGVASFGSAFGCHIGLPAVFSRVTSYIYFFRKHII